MEKEQVVENTDNIDWKVIQAEVEVLYSAWPSIVLDLNSANVESSKIVEFSKNLDEALISVKNKEKEKTGENLAKVYSFLPEFTDKTEIEELKKDTWKAKAHVLNAYSKVGTKDWEQVKKEIDETEKIFEKLVNNIKNDDKRKYTINKIYVLTEELKNSLSTKDEGIFYIKYKNLLEELNMLI